TCFFVMIIYLLHSSHSVAGLVWFQARSHLERRAFDNQINDGVQAVSVLPRLPDDASHDRHIGRFEAAPQSVNHHALRNDGGEGFGPAEDGLPQCNWPVDL